MKRIFIIIVICFTGITLSAQSSVNSLFKQWIIEDINSGKYEKALSYYRQTDWWFESDNLDYSLDLSKYDEFAAFVLKTDIPPISKVALYQYAADALYNYSLTYEENNNSSEANRYRNISLTYYETALRMIDECDDKSYPYKSRKQLLLFNYETALVKQSFYFIDNNDYTHAEDVLLQALSMEQRRQKLSDVQIFNLGLDLSDVLRTVRTWSVENSNGQTTASVVDDVNRVIKQGTKNANGIQTLIAAADYYQQIYDERSRDYCLRTAYQWVKDNPSLRNQLSKDILFSLFLNCTTRYCRECEPIMTEADLQDATNYIKNEFGAKSFYAYQYEIGKVLYYSYLHELDKAIAQCKAIEEILEKELKAKIYSNEERENIREQYVQASVFLSDLYGSKYPYSAYQYKSIDDTSTGNSPSQEQMLAYNIMKKVLDDSRLNKDLHLGCYQSMIYMCYHFEKFEEMWNYVPQYYTLTQQTIDNALTTMSEGDALHWWGNSLPFMYNDYIILSTNRCNLPTGISGYIYNNELFKKDLLLRTNKRLQQYISENSDSTIIYLYNNLVSQKAQLIQLQSQKQMEASQKRTIIIAKSRWKIQQPKPLGNQ